MELVVLGPNLSSAGQRKGDLHVHKAGCGDLKHYGRGTKYGGDVEGHKDSVHSFASVADIVHFCYPPDDFGYDPDVETDAYASDFYFAPCCKGLEGLRK